MAFMLAIFLLADSSTALAAGFSSDIGLKAGDGSFQNNLTSITNGMFAVARIISTIMIAIAGLMIAFNVESANKTTWNIILGIGLALNFGTVLMSAYGATSAWGEIRQHSSIKCTSMRIRTANGMTSCSPLRGHILIIQNPGLSPLCQLQGNCSSY